MLSPSITFRSLQRRVFAIQRHPYLILLKFSEIFQQRKLTHPFSVPSFSEKDEQQFEVDVAILSGQPARTGSTLTLPDHENVCDGLLCFVPPSSLSHAFFFTSSPTRIIKKKS